MDVHSLLRPLVILGALPARLIRRRRELLELLGADDRVLSDMGLSRREVFSALARSLWRDKDLSPGNRARRPEP